jgi:hypothetical protein
MHSVLSASGAHRWWPCPGSINATSGAPRIDSTYSIEGTAAHELAALCLTEGRNADHYIGIVIGDTTVTAVVATGVQMYIDTCRRIIDASDVHHIEQRFDLQALDPPAPMFGTCDFCAYSAKRRELNIVDLKFGKGVWVNAKNNRQLLYYAVGAVLAINKPVSTIVMTVVQPRYAKGDPVRTATIDLITLAEWSIELMDHARAALEPNAPTVAGDWCKFCPAKPSCLAFQNSKVTEAFHQFSLANIHDAGA